MVSTWTNRALPKKCGNWCRCAFYPDICQCDDTLISHHSLSFNEVPFFVSPPWNDEQEKCWIVKMNQISWDERKNYSNDPWEPWTMYHERCYVFAAPFLYFECVNVNDIRAVFIKTNPSPKSPIIINITIIINCHLNTVTSNVMKVKAYNHTKVNMDYRVCLDSKIFLFFLRTRKRTRCWKRSVHWI